MNMHIGIVSDFFGAKCGGSDTVTRNWVKKLLERGHKVTIITAHNKNVPFGKNKNLRVIKFFGVPIPKTGKRVYGAIPLNPFKLYKIYKIIKNEIDVIHVFLVPSLISSVAITLARWAKKPVVSSIHVQPENIGYNIKSKTFNPVDKILIFLDKFIPMKRKNILKWSYNYLANAYFNKSNLVVGPTNFAIDTYKKFGLKVPTKVISNGVDFSQFNGHGRAEVFLNKYKLQREIPKVMYVGRLDSEKRVDVIIKAARFVIDKIPETLFIIIGTGSEERELRTLTRKLKIENNVIFTGKIPDKLLPHAYHACNLFVSASIAELQGIVLLEAMSAGKPLVGTNLCAIPEAVVDDYNGYTFKKNDFKDLSEKILKILESKEIQEKFSSNSLKMVKNHDIDKSINLMEDEYKKLVSEFSLAS